MNTSNATAARHPFRCRDDASALVQAYRSGRDPAARERLVERHLPLVCALARRYANRGERFEDLVQVGSIGLIEAIDRFDPERSDDFTSFAIPTIKGAIRHHLRDRAAVVRIPRRLSELTSALRPHHDRLAHSLSRSPTLAELARETGLGERDVADAIETERARSPLTLSAGEDAHAGADPALTIDGSYASTDDRLMLVAGLRTLAMRERRIMHLHFFAGLSQTEIAHEVGLSQVQVSRLIRASLVRMRAALGADRPLARGRTVDGV